MRVRKWLRWGLLGMVAGLICIAPAHAQSNVELRNQGWYADPEAHVFAGQYWIYPTASLSENAPVRITTFNAEQEQLRSGHMVHGVYGLQAYLDAFSSPDLVHWTLHKNVLDVKNVPWAAYAVWAPSAVYRNGRYYLFFAANDIQKTDTFAGGIGVAVSDQPGGPFLDALGKPLVGRFENGAQPIDPMVFQDDDGSVYLYYGGQGHCNVARLSSDLLHVIPMQDGTMYREITPSNYVEGPFLLKRHGVYYFMWSEGDWGDASYGVAYAKSNSPTGPFVRAGKILSTDAKVANGPGHHSVLQIPGADEYYIVYHRHPLGTTGINQRVLAIDRMRFDAAGNIQPVAITTAGVPARPLATQGAR